MDAAMTEQSLLDIIENIQGKMPKQNFFMTLPEAAFTPAVRQAITEHVKINRFPMPDHLQADEEFCLEAIRHNPYGYAGIKIEHRTEAIMYAAVKANNGLIRHVPKQAVSERIARLVLNRLPDFKDKADFFLLAYIPAQYWRANEAEKIVRRRPEAFGYIPIEYRSLTLSEFVLEHSLDMFKKIPPKVMTSDLVAKLCQLSQSKGSLKNPNHIRFSVIPERLRTDEVCKLLVDTLPKNINLVPPERDCFIELVTHAFAKDPSMINNFRMPRPKTDAEAVKAIELGQIFFEGFIIPAIETKTSSQPFSHYLKILIGKTNTMLGRAMNCLESPLPNRTFWADHIDLVQQLNEYIFEQRDPKFKGYLLLSQRYITEAIPRQKTRSSNVQELGL